VEGEPASSLSGPGTVCGTGTGCAAAGLDALILAACSSAEAPLLGSEGFNVPLSLLSNSASGTCGSYDRCGVSTEHVPMVLEGVTAGGSSVGVSHEDRERDCCQAPPMGGEGIESLLAQGGGSDIGTDREVSERACMCQAAVPPSTVPPPCLCAVEATINSELQKTELVEEEKLETVTVSTEVEKESSKEKDKEKEKGKDTMKKLVSLASAVGWEGGPIGECLDLSFDDVMTHRILSGKERGKWRPEKSAEKESKAPLPLNPTPQVVWPVASSDCPTPVEMSAAATSSSDGAAEEDRDKDREGEGEGEVSQERVADPGSSFRMGDDAEDLFREDVHVVSLPPPKVHEEEQETSPLMDQDQEAPPVQQEANPWEWDFLSNMIDKDILTDKVDIHCSLLHCTALHCCHGYITAMCTVSCPIHTLEYRGYHLYRVTLHLDREYLHSH
jgi:hypothetical protein